MAAQAPSHVVQWDVKLNRPIVGGNIEHPETGEVTPHSRPMTAGPPSIDFILHNIDSTHHSLTTLRRPYHTSVNQVYIAYAKLVKDGILDIVSVNASAYSFVLVCVIKVPEEEFKTAKDEVEEEFLRRS